MIYQDREVKLKDGRSAVLRNARVEDSTDLIKYLKTTATETPYLINELEKITLTLEEDPEAQYDGIRRINARDWLLGLTD